MAIKKQTAAKKSVVAKKSAPAPSAQELQAQELFQQGLMEYMEEKYPAAVTAWEKALALNPRLDTARAYLAKAKANLPQIDKIRRPAAVATATQEQAEEAYRQGLQQYRQKKFSEARELWQKTLQMDPGHADARRGLERIDAILKMFQERGVDK